MRTIALAVMIAAALALVPIGGLGDSTSGLVTPTSRDGHKDFDFLMGTWHTHYRLLQRRLANDHTWYDCYGTSTVSSFWGGSGNLEDGDLQCPHKYVGGMTLRLYNAGTHQWSLYWGTRALGLVPPPQIGHFNANHVGEFYANDKYKDKLIVVRFKWELRAGDHPYFEQAFSADNGKTWEPNWTTVYTRISSEAVRSPSP